MAYDSDPAPARPFIQQTYGYYASLMAIGTAHRSSEAREGLGGQLFWAGELDELGRALTVAGNVAGAATLAATSDQSAQRSAVRDGVADFLVNSLDEALRILKNEVRKRATVAVCVAAPLEAIEREMAERGVQPDVLREGILRAAGLAEERTRNEEPPSDPMSVPAWVTWSVDRAPALWLPRLDAIALDCLGREEEIARRWLERSSRYLGRTGNTEHMVRSNRQFAALFSERIRDAVNRSEITSGATVQVLSPGPDLMHFNLPEKKERGS